MENCTRCGKELDEVKVDLRLSISANRKSESDIWEVIPNSQVTPIETLCKDCFDSFTEVIGKVMNV